MTYSEQQLPLSKTLYFPSNSLISQRKQRVPTACLPVELAGAYHESLHAHYFA